MSGFFTEAWARLVLRFSPARERWLSLYGRYLPMLTDAFRERAEDILLVLRAMEDIEDGRLARAQQRLQLIGFRAKNSGKGPENALHMILQGLFHLRRGDTYEMARCLRKAEEYGHKFHLPHMMLAVHYIHDRWFFDEAIEALDKGIDCLYAYPPLDEGKRRIIAGMHSMMALCCTMMHRYDEADRLLTKANLAEDFPDYLHAMATLRAVQGRHAEALAALEALQKADEKRWQEYEPGIRLMLEGTHPHFTAKEPDREAIAAYWDWFVSNEREIRRVLNQEGPKSCFNYQREAFAPLVPEPASIDMMSHAYRIEGSQLQMHFCAHYSRTYQALIEALVEGCPPQVRKHWQILTFTECGRSSFRQMQALMARKAEASARKEEDA